MKTGTGLTEHYYNYDDKKIIIDFSGERDGQCYRNDASIFFFAANSYRESFYIISDEIKSRFENRCNHKSIEHLILPYYFSFRHYLELVFKAIIASISNEKTKDTHSLKILIKDLYDAIISISENGKHSIFQENFNENKAKVRGEYDTIHDLVNQYLLIEPSVEYYRYLFKTKMELKNPELVLDYDKIDNIFRNIDTSIIKMIKTLREMDIYVYFTL